MKQGKNNEIDSGDYYVIKGIKILKDDPNLIFDYTSKRYESLSQHNNHVFLQGIVGFHKNGKIKTGWFRKNKFVNITIVTSNGNQYQGVDYELVRGNYSYRENTSNGYFYYYKILSAIDFSAQRAIQRQEKNALPYNLGGQYQRDFENAFKASKIIPRKEVRPIAKLLDGLSFGLEFETTLGFVPPRLTGDLGLAPLRDGSIDGIEYVTVPLQGEKGLEGLIQSLDLLKERTSFDNSCSLHLHIGNIPRTKQFILALFVSAIYLQDEMFSLFPVTKRFNWGIKNKNYTKPYNPLEIFTKFDESITKDNLANNFNIFINNLAVSSQYNNANLSDVHTHPQDPENNRKWNISTRYYWLNFIPILFANKATVEFRIHTPTFEAHKILSYLLICGGIVNYVKQNKKQILANHRKMMYGRRIEDLLYSAGKNDKINNALFEYIRARKYGSTTQNSAGNVQGDEGKIHAYDVLGPSYGKRIIEKSIFKPKNVTARGVIENQATEVYLDANGVARVRVNPKKKLGKPMHKHYHRPSKLTYDILHDTFKGQLEKTEELIPPPIESNMGFHRTAPTKSEAKPPEEEFPTISNSGFTTTFYDSLNDPIETSGDMQGVVFNDPFEKGDIDVGTSGSKQISKADLEKWKSVVSEAGEQKWSSFKSNTIMYDK